MDLKSYVFGIISTAFASLIVTGILRLFSRRKPSKTQLSIIFTANGKFRGFLHAYELLTNNNKTSDNVKENIVNNHIKGLKLEARKMIENKIKISISKNIIKKCESESVNNLINYLNKAVPRLQNYYDKWMREYDK